ncbi:Alpha/Beta hydrolase protein [Mucidula mucida]|nr:Alpha/Beta hydrolase protein [Mucidula mucida]
MALTIQLSTGVSLEAELCVPQAESSGGARLAIFLHPWSWLGGRMDDPVVSVLMDTFARHNFHMLRYNSRGVGRSTGWASLTGSSEGEDLCALVKWALERIGNVKNLVLVGYSYGSLITTLCPSLPSIPTSYLLVSYPVGPRAWLTLFRSSLYERALGSILETKARVLIVYGTEDEFTSVERYEQWTSGLSSEENLEVTRIEGGSHFWRGSSSRRLSATVDAWLLHQSH